MPKPIKRILNRIIGLSVLLVGLSGCQIESVRPESNAAARALIATSVKVRVVHPVIGSGPGFLVRYYTSRKEYTENKIYAKAITNSQGEAHFPTVPIGFGLVACRIAGNPELAGDTIFTVYSRQTPTVNLVLR